MEWNGMNEWMNEANVRYKYYRLRELKTCIYIILPCEIEHGWMPQQNEVLQ